MLNAFVTLGVAHVTYSGNFYLMKRSGSLLKSIALEQGCATHGPRATIRPSRPVNVALDDGRTKNFFF